MKEWAPKDWCFLTVVLEKTLESPLDSKDIKPVNPKGNQPWIFIGRTDPEAEAPILWPLDANSRLIGKDRDAGKTESKRRGQQSMRWLDRIIDAMDLNVSKLRKIVKRREAWHAAVHQVTKNLTRLSDWTDWLTDHPTISFPVTTSPLAFSLSQPQDLFQWVGSLPQVGKVLELQLQHQSFQWIFRVGFL